MEHDNRPSIAGFYWDAAPAVGEAVRLPNDLARHAHVRRLHPGARVRLSDGRGGLSLGEATVVGAKEFIVTITERTVVPAPTPLHVVVPVADKDRMLFAAEKCVELQVTSWRPVWFARSRSVSPRGEGEKFREKLRARMISALEQSGGAWLPEIHAEADFDEVTSGLSMPLRLLLDAGGTPIGDLNPRVPTAIAVGPEGGVEPMERDAARSNGWVTASLAATTLRFETALLAGVAVVRALQQSTRNG